MKYDATNFAESDGVLYPHLSIKGKNYENENNTNGDVRDHGLVIENNTISYNNVTYELVTEWSMPVLRVTR